MKAFCYLSFCGQLLTGQRLAAALCQEPKEQKTKNAKPAWQRSISQLVGQSSRGGLTESTAATELRGRATALLIFWGTGSVFRCQQRLQRSLQLPGIDFWHALEFFLQRWQGTRALLLKRRNGGCGVAW